MSKTIRNERTKGYLDKVQTERRTKKIIRCLKADKMFCEFDLAIINEFE